MDQKIRVLQFPIAKTKGGRTQYILNNWRHIDKKRFQFDFVTFSDELDFEDDLVSEGCKVYHISCYFRDDPKQFVKELDAILQQGYDAIHLHTSYWENTIVEERAKENGIKKIIIHSHSTGITKAKDQKEDVEKTKIHFEVRDQIDFGIATDYCACSKDAAKWLFGSRVPEDRIRILNNAIETERFKYDETVRNAARKELGADADSILLAVVGRLAYPKNQEFLINILPKLVKEIHAKLMIVGDGPKAIELQMLGHSLGVERDILFLGYRKDVPYLLQAADIYCMPSEFEGFPISLVEAQCIGLPCVVSDAISEESVLTELVYRLGLLPEHWINEICEISNNIALDRRRYCREIRGKGYDIYDQIKVLEAMYADGLLQN